MRLDPPGTSCYDASMSGEDNNNLVNFIATTVEAMRDQMATMREQMATKNDIVRLESRMEKMRAEMATELARTASKDDLNSLRAQMATKDDLELLATVVRGDFEQVHFRFDTLERVMSTRFGQVETDY